MKNEQKSYLFNENELSFEDYLHQNMLGTYYDVSYHKLWKSPSLQNHLSSVPIKGKQIQTFSRQPKLCPPS